MAERRKNRKRKDQSENTVIDEKPSKDEYSVAKYLRDKLPEKKTSLLGHKVDYFIASKAIDCLLDSHWATKSRKNEPLFTNRDSVIDFMDRMLQHKFFHRARKIIIQKDQKKGKKEATEDASSTAKVTKEKDGKEQLKGKEKSTSSPAGKKKKSKNSEVEKEEIPESTQQETKEPVDDKKPTKKAKSSKDEKQKEETKADETKDTENPEKKKEKKKLKLDMHMEQLFLDGSEVYVWIYDPIPVRTWIIGMMMVVGAVLVCLFPLWPQVIRHYIYYISVAAALFLVFIIGLAIIRLIVFVIIWAVTFGRHHLWLLPNLTADVGFFESFWPLYEYEYKGAKKTSKEKEGKKEKKSKNKPAEDDSKDDEKKEQNDSAAEKSDSSTDLDKKDEEGEKNSESEQESEDDENVAKTDNGENGFEIVEKNEAEEVKSEELKKVE